MRAQVILLGLMVCAATGCSPHGSPSAGAAERTVQTSPAAIGPPQAGYAGPGQWRGFDRNDYPGVEAMRSFHSTFAFTGYWLTNPPGENSNSWMGKRAELRAQDWGFLVLANGRLDAEILKAQRAGTPAAELGRRDAEVATENARRDGFAPGTILFLDQEEGGRLLPEQAAYLLAWTEAVAAGGFRGGVYASGQSVEDSPGVTIDTIQDIRGRVEAGKLHPVAIFDALDQCPPAPGCTLHSKPLSAAPDSGLIAWQYAQSPRRPEITKSCGSTYAVDGNCYAPGVPHLFLDMDVAATSDPSNGR